MWITISSPGQEPRSAQLQPGRHTVGRESDNSLIIADDRVSKRHAVLDLTEAGAWITDLGSTNGTFVNGDRLMGEPVWASPGAEITVGTALVRLGATEPTTRSDQTPARSGLVGPPQHADPSVAPDPLWQSQPTPGQLSSLNVSDAGPVAGGNVQMSGHQVIGRDYVEGFKIRTRMRRTAKNCIRLGCVLMLAGMALFGYFVITWNSKIFDAVNDLNAEPPDDLPAPVPWLPLGAGLTFLGIVLVVVGLLVPRDREYAPRER